MFKISFFSNYLSHHQIPFSLELNKMSGIEYTFVSTIPMDDERIHMGWKIEDEFAFELKAYESDENLEKAKQLAIDSDVVIIGSAPDEFIIPRLKQYKLTFRYSERPYKDGINIRNFIRILGGTWLHHGRFQNKPLYMLCASSYTASDFYKMGCYKNKCYRWGYFPEVKEYDIQKLMESKSDIEINILWVGRLIPLKHPEQALRLASKLKRQGYSFRLNIVGDGEMRSFLEQYQYELDVADKVIFNGSVPADEVRAYMEKASVFLFTSDKREGWGAVLNESMNSGCVVVANDEIGSVGFLLQDEKNGLIYHNGDEEMLLSQVKRLMNSTSLRKQLGYNAYRTIRDTWSAQNAAVNFMRLTQNLLNGDHGIALVGPGSKIS